MVSVSVYMCVFVSVSLRLCVSVCLIHSLLFRVYRIPCDICRTNPRGLYLVGSRQTCKRCFDEAKAAPAPEPADESSTSEELSEGLSSDEYLFTHEELARMNITELRKVVSDHILPGAIIKTSGPGRNRARILTDVQAAVGLERHRYYTTEREERREREERLRDREDEAKAPPACASTAEAVEEPAGPSLSPVNVHVPEEEAKEVVSQSRRSTRF